MAASSRSLFERRSGARMLTLHQLAEDNFRAHPPPTHGSVPLSTIVSSPICSPIRTPETSLVEISDPDSPFTTAPSSPTKRTPDPLPRWIATPPTPAAPRTRTNLQRSKTTNKRHLPPSATFPNPDSSTPRTLTRSISLPCLSTSPDLVAEAPWLRDNSWNALCAHHVSHSYAKFSGSRGQSYTSSSEDNEPQTPLRQIPQDDDLRTYHATMEIFTTEMGYLADLKALVAVYLPNLSNLTAKPTSSRQAVTFSSLSRPSTSATPIDEAVTGSPPREKEIFSQLLLSNREVDCLRRNADELLSFHRNFAIKLQAIATAFHLSLETETLPSQSIDIDALVDAVARLFITEASKFDIYERFCARHQESLDIVRRLQHHHRYEWELFERQSAGQVFESLDVFRGPTSLEMTRKTQRRRSHSITSLDGVASVPENSRRVSRLTFLDYMIKPIQRICKYPLLLDQLRRTGKKSSFVVESASLCMRQVASAVDEARHKQDIVVQTSTILSRISIALPMPKTSHIQPLNRELRQLTPSFISSLGSCLMSGPLDVYRPVNSLQVTIRAKYMGVFLYVGGYIIIVKVTKKMYDPRYWFKIDNVVDGDVVLPNALRIKGGNFELELVSSCAAEREIWLKAIRESLSLQESEWINEPIPSHKLNERPQTPNDTQDESIREFPLSAPAVLSNSAEFPALTEELLAAFEANSKHRRKADGYAKQDPRAPSRRSSTASVKALFTTMNSDSTSVVVQRASSTVRMHVDNGLQDVISEPCQNARLLAYRDEDITQTQRPKSASGSIHSTKSTKSRIYRTSETVRIPRSRSLAESDTSAPRDHRRIPSHIRITPVIEPPSDDAGALLSATSNIATSPTSLRFSDAGSSKSAASDYDSQRPSPAENPNPPPRSKSVLRNVKAMLGRESPNTLKDKDKNKDKPAEKQGNTSKKNTLLRRLIG